VGPRAVLDAMVKRKIPSPRRFKIILVTASILSSSDTKPLSSVIMSSMTVATLNLSCGAGMSDLVAVRGVLNTGG
jgi:hypothetical protein